MAWRIKKKYFSRIFNMMIIFALLFIVVYSVTLAFNSVTKDDPLTLRILQGMETTIVDHPYLASIQKKIKSGEYVHVCGGTIIKSTAILSAAHCFVKKSGTVLSAKKWQTRVGSSFTMQGGNVYKLSKIYAHNFVNSTKNNDIAVVQTSKSMAYVKNAIAPVTLASKTHILINGEGLWVIGWGRTEPYTLRSRHHSRRHTSHHKKSKTKSSFMEESLSYDTSSRQLNEVMLEFMDNEKCNKEYEFHKVNQYDMFNNKMSGESTEFMEIVNENMLCGFDKSRRGVCTGDSGGPVIHNGVLVGLVSWSGAFCNSTLPVVATRVANYLDWIEAVSVP